MNRAVVAALFITSAASFITGDRRPHQLRRVAALRATYCLNVNLFVKPERREEFLKCIEANAHGTMSTEPAAIEYRWGESVDEPNTFHFHEKYKDKDGFLAHTKTPHFADWEAFASSDPFTKPPEVTFFESR